MSRTQPQDHYAMHSADDGLDTSPNRFQGLGDKKSAVNYPRAEDDTAYGEMEDHYGGTKIGQFRVRTHRTHDSHTQL